LKKYLDSLRNLVSREDKK